MHPLIRVRRATARRNAAVAKADAEWQDAIRDAVKAGESLRAVGGAAGVSHVRVLQVTRQ
jgi:hypothetical protein